MSAKRAVTVLRSPLLDEASSGSAAIPGLEGVDIETDADRPLAVPQ